jgi:hypothetical protein
LDRQHHDARRSKTAHSRHHRGLLPGAIDQRAARDVTEPRSAQATSGSWRTRSSLPSCKGERHTTDGPPQTSCHCRPRASHGSDADPALRRRLIVDVGRAYERSAAVACVARHVSGERVLPEVEPAARRTRHRLRRAPRIAPRTSGQLPSHVGKAQATRDQARPILHE